MKINLSIWYTVTGIILLISSSCRHEPVLSADTPLICFQDNIQPLIQSNCAMAGCHDANAHGERPSFSTYEEIRNQVVPGKPNKSPIYRAITSNMNTENFMPPSPRTPLTIEQISMISIWILQGAENNTCPTTPCDSVNVSYSADISPIIVNYCKGCHSGPNPEGGTFLESYNQVKAVAQNGQLYGAVSHSPGFIPMPYQSPKLPQCDIAMIAKWISDDTPNN